MWSRCWWATWVSGFFGIFGVLHLVRLVVPVRIVIGYSDVPRAVTALIGMVCLGISAGLLVIETRREHAKRADRAQCS